MIRTFAVAALLSSAFVATAHADARDSELIASFKQLCTGGRPNLTQIGQRAQAMQLTSTQQATSQPSGSGGTIVSQVWAGTLAGGVIELVGSEVSDARGQMSTCGVSAADANGTSFKQDLIAAMNLGAPSGVNAAPGSAMTLTSWNGAFGPNTSLQFMQAASPNTPGITITYAAKGQ